MSFLNNMIKIIQALCLLLICGSVYSQKYTYSFDNCDASGSGTETLGGIISGSPECECGLASSSFYLDGNGDGFSMPDTATSILGNDFTLDFYFHLEDKTVSSDILSIRHGCTTDSFISVKYIPSSNKLLMEFGISRGLYYSMNKVLSNKCWHRLTLVKFNLDYIFYLDNKEVGTINADENIPFSKTANISISNSPCIGPGLSRLAGNIDEFKLYDRALSFSELTNSNLYANAFITNDTTIFLGESVRLLFGATCSNNSVWTPSTDLDDPSSLSPIATPKITTTYHLNTNENGCIDGDSVTVYIFDKNNLDCEELLLPTAFSPNGDLLNDVYGISNTFIVEKLVLFEILDRWGNIVFNTSDLFAKWDGQFKNKLCDPGVYYARIIYFCNEKEEKKIQNFVLLR